MHRPSPLAAMYVAFGTAIAFFLIITAFGVTQTFPVTTEAAVIEISSAPVVFDGLRHDEPIPTPEPVEVVEPVVTQDPTNALEYGPSYTDKDVEVLAKVVWAEARGLSKMEQAAVIWCVLNRVDDTENDYWPDTIIGVATQPNQFAYYKNAPVKDEFVELAVDVLERWDAEKHGCIMPGRVLPKEYTFFFSRNTDENLFRSTYECHEVFWDWSMPNPYE